MRSLLIILMSVVLICSCRRGNLSIDEPIETPPVVVVPETPGEPEVPEVVEEQWSLTTSYVQDLTHIGPVNIVSGAIYNNAGVALSSSDKLYCGHSYTWQVNHNIVYDYADFAGRGIIPLYNLASTVYNSIDETYSTIMSLTGDSTASITFFLDCDDGTQSAIRSALSESDYPIFEIKDSIVRYSDNTISSTISGTLKIYPSLDPQLELIEPVLLSTQDGTIVTSVNCSDTYRIRSKVRPSLDPGDNSIGVVVSTSTSWIGTSNPLASDGDIDFDFQAGPMCLATLPGDTLSVEIWRYEGPELNRVTVLTLPLVP